VNATIPRATRGVSVRAQAAPLREGADSGGEAVRLAAVRAALADGLVVTRRPGSAYPLACPVSRDTSNTTMPRATIAPSVYARGLGSKVDVLFRWADLRADACNDTCNDAMKVRQELIEADVAWVLDNCGLCQNGSSSIGPMSTQW
jgi:hypothetical protein